MYDLEKGEVKVKKKLYFLEFLGYWGF